MGLNTTTTIEIGGSKLETYKSLNLVQEIDAHHTLELVVPRDYYETMDTDLGAEVTKLLGETITLSIEPTNSSARSFLKLEFNGIVAGVRMVRAADSSGGEEVYILGKSLTYKMENDPHYVIHEEKNLRDIVNATLGNFSGIPKSVQPKHSTTFDYVVQHNESSFQFLSRLAAQYGEWLYYDGVKVIFGKPGTDEMPLAYGIDLKQYEINVMPANSAVSFYASDYFDGGVISAVPSVPSINNFVNEANRASNTLFPSESVALSPVAKNAQMAENITVTANGQVNATAVNQVVLRGVSLNPGVVVGKIVKIDGIAYRVVSSHHMNSIHGNYQNQFQAVYASGDHYPKANINAFPRSASTVARVTENANDPDGLGRIRVALPWMQTMGLQSPWLRIVHPHAGENHGFRWLPEIDDEVLVDFEDGNAESPYVVGSLYNSQAMGDHPEPTPQNDVKIIKTRTGHTITLDDTDGAEKISIVDSTGSNSVTIDSSSNTLTIASADRIELKAMDIAITAQNSLTMQAQQKIDMSTAQLNAESSASMTLKSSGTADLQGSVTGVKGSGTVKVEGSMAEVNGSGVTIIKGGTVLLN